MHATDKDLELLEKMYENRDIYQGELHDHANTGGTSDGKRTLEHWKGAMEALEMDFATILDHKQVRHMYIPEWDNTMFIGGTEPACSLLNEEGEKLGKTHYNMIFSDPKELEGLLEEFPEYEFTGGPEGHFIYPRFTVKRFGELIDAVKRRGGFFVIPHAAQMSYGQEHAEDWVIREGIGFEAIYINLWCDYSKQNYELWRKLIGAGKRMWACSGGDKHSRARDWALTSIYAEEKVNSCFVKHLRKGDFAAGSVAIKMCIGDTQMGGSCDFEGQRLVIGVEKFHRSVRNPEHQYRFELWGDEDIVYSQEISCEEPTYFAMDAKDYNYYRVEIHDATRDLRIAIGNPIWNDRK